MVVGFLAVSKEPYPDKTVVGLNVLGVLERIIDQGKTRSLGTTEGGSKAEDEDAFVVLHVVALGQLSPKFLALGGSTARVEHVQNLTVKIPT